MRVLVLFGLGAFLAYVHKNEDNAWKIVQLGLGIPALALSLINANVSNDSRQRAAIDSALFATISSLSLISEAAAQERPANDLKEFTLAEQSALRTIFYNGFLGVPRKHLWFVIPDTAPTVAQAREKALQINQKIGDIHAEVYKPAGNDKDYPVVVGPAMKFDNAMELVEKINKATGTTKARVWSLEKVK